MGNIRVLGNIGSQRGGNGSSIIFACQNTINSEIFAVQVEKRIGPDGSPVTPAQSDWKYKSRTFLNTGTTNGITLDSRVDVSKFTDTKPSFVGADDTIADSEFNNAGALKQQTNPTGNVAMLSLLGDGVTASFIDTIGFSSNGGGSNGGANGGGLNGGFPNSRPVPTGVVASISTFINENPVTSFLIGLGVAGTIYLIWDANQDDDKPKSKGKKRR